MTKIKDEKQKNCGKECSYQKYQEKALELEVDEELRQDQLAKFWQKYRYAICGAVVAILGITAGAEIYQTWWANVRLRESDAFEQGAIAAFSGDYEKARPHFQQLADNAKTGYRYLAQMELAGLALQNNEKEQALQLLKGIMDSTAPKSLRSVATLSYVGQQLETLDAKLALDLLQPLLDDSAYVVPAAQLAFALYMKSGETEQAKATITKALATPDLSTDAKNKLEILQTMIGN